MGIQSPNRDVVFISHANPEDNVFARWLSLKLATFGYRVWSDVTKFLGGEDFWQEIEPIIRDSTVKFLYVLSRASNRKDGVLRELRVADATRKTLDGTNDFVIPLRVDDLPHRDINIEIGRLNAIEFGDGWASGLEQLHRKLSADGVPLHPGAGPALVRKWWEDSFSANKLVGDTNQSCYSNWFLLRLPKKIFRYSMIGPLDPEPAWSFPTRWHNNRLLTFACASDIEKESGLLRIQKTDAMNTSSFLLEENENRRDNRNIIFALLTDAWETYCLKMGLKKYTLANDKSSFYFNTDALSTPMVRFRRSVDQKNTRRSLLGYKTVTTGKRHWHFAISARPAFHPKPMLQIRTHVLFSDDGRNVWPSLSKTHRARRSQCKDWWNDDWRDRLLASMSWLSSSESSIVLPLSTSSENVVIDVDPVEFISPVKLKEEAVRMQGEEQGAFDDE